MCGSIKSQKNGGRLLCDLDGLMASVMGKGCEVCGRCVEGIDLSVKLKK
jgi:hypothetical protein